MITNQAIIDAVNRIMTLALTTESDHIFVEYSPHVQQLLVRCHCGGWIENNDDTWLRRAYLDQPDALERLVHIENTIRTKNSTKICAGNVEISEERARE
ncbi:MAG: hypothetical protein M0P69_16915 [Bacteroidales bacterium]|nr:hypothetical protein [Bacteroidales bacterium]